jgi:hypothetical protein
MDPVEQKTSTFSHECRIRDFYANNLSRERADELLLDTEHSFSDGSTRADMFTVDKSDLMRIWEFKIKADYEALGQILTYVALAKQKTDFKRSIRGVIAAFEFRREIQIAIEVLNLGIEQVIIPAWMAQAGNIPLTLQVASPPPVKIPFINQ